MVCAPEKGEKRIGEERGLWLRSCAGYRFTAQTGAASRSLGTSQAFDASSEGTTKVRTCQEAKTEITRNRFLVDFFFFLRCKCKKNYQRTPFWPLLAQYEEGNGNIRARWARRERY